MKKIKCWNYVKMALVLLATGLLTYACKRDYDIADVERPRGNKELSASAARQWFESNYKPVVGLSFGNRTNSGGVALKSSSGNPMPDKSKSEVLIKPKWDRPREGRKGNIEVVEVSASTNKGVFFMDEETKSRRTSSDGKSMRNTARVVIHKDVSTGKTRSFLMVFVGTYDYLKSSNNIAKNGYFKRDPNFEGDVMFYNLDGSLINGWRYRNKKIVARITPAGSKAATLNSRMQAGNNKNAPSGNVRMSGGYMDCRDELLYYDEQEECHQEGREEWDDELGWVAVVDMVCETISTPVYTRVCEWIEDPWEPPFNPDYPDPGYVDPNPPTNPPENTNIVVVLAPTATINLQDRLNCFNSVPTNNATTYNITLHAHKGVAGGNKPGHAFITLEKSNGSNTQRLSYGFYPVSSLSSATMLPVASAIGEEYSDPDRYSDSRYSLTINAAQFQTAISTSLTLAGQQYDLNDYNCVHYATDVFNTVNPPTGQINNSGFIMPDDLHVYLQHTNSMSPNQGINIGRIRPAASTNCN